MAGKENIFESFGGKLRIRVCGILLEDESILLVKHKYLGTKGILWAPPGGGMIFNQTTEENLIREFREETGLEVAVENFLFINEFLDPPLHAIELFFEVKRQGGQLTRGWDPEMSGQEQIIESVNFLNMADLRRIPIEQLHHIFSIEINPIKIKQLNGMYNFHNR